MGFVPQLVEFGVKFIFLLKNYAITWKDGWNTSYLVAIKWVLFPNILSLVSNSIFLLKIYAITWKDGWNMSYLVTTKCVLPPPRIELSPKLKLKFEII
jgi:hypothetical protein